MAAPQYASHPTYQAIINLGTRADIPVFAVRYKDDFSEFKVIPLNPIAKTKLSVSTVMTEREWVTFLYRLRGYDPPVELFEAASVKI